MAKKKLVIPSFKNEGEEATWWDKHRATVEATCVPPCVKARLFPYMTS